MSRSHIASFVIDEEWKAAVVTKYREGAEDAPVCWLEAGWASFCLPLNDPVSTSPSRQTPPVASFPLSALFISDKRFFKKDKKNISIAVLGLFCGPSAPLLFKKKKYFSLWRNMLFHPPLLYILITHIPSTFSLFNSFFVFFGGGTIPESAPLKGCARWRSKCSSPSVWASKTAVAWREAALRAV